MALRHRMERKDHIDTFGAMALTAFALHLAFNQVVIKVTNGGFEPVFLAGLRSLGAVVIVLLWIVLRGGRPALTRASAYGGILAGACFALEFMCLFKALDITTVSRASIIFYSMPVWLALLAHLFLPAERLSGVRVIGFALAMTGVVLALFDRSHGASLWGDLLALVAALCWAGVALSVRLTDLKTLKPADQLLWQLIVSAPILLIAAPWFGPLIRDVAPIHLWGLAFQIVCVASLGFLGWFWLMSIYPASGVASFSFLSPVFSVIFGWWLLDETVGASIWIALGCVAVGLAFINKSK